MDEFGIEEARKAGHSDEDIARALAAHNGEDPTSVDEAFKAGHSYTEIANHLAGYQPPEIQPSGDYEGDPTKAAVAGGVAGGALSVSEKAGKGLYSLAHKLVDKIGPPTQQVVPPIQQAAPPMGEPPVAPIEIPPEPSSAAAANKQGATNWNRSLTGGEQGMSIPGSQMDKESLAKNRELMKKVHEMGGSLTESGIIKLPETTHNEKLAKDALERSRNARIESAAHDAQLQQDARMTAKLNAEKAAKAAHDASLAGRVEGVTNAVKQFASPVTKPISKAISVAKPVTDTLSKISNIPVVGRALAGAGALGEGQDAYNRYQHGDYGRALISGLGALGSAATVLPSPVTKGVGAAAGMAAPAINGLIDKYLGRDGYADGGLAKTDAQKFQLSTGALEDLLAGNTDISHFLPQAKHELTHLPKADAKYAQDLAMNFGPMGVGSITGAGGKKLGEILRPMGERFGYNEAKVAKNYPDTIPGTPAVNPKNGNTFIEKALSPEALAVQKARKAAQKEIDTGNYTPHFDISQRSHVDPANYPLPVRTIDVTLPKKADTLAAHQAKANSPEAIGRLNAAYDAAVNYPNAHDFYAMKQLEDEFIKYLGPEEGRAAFKSRFADPMAVTTGGSDPNANLMTAAYTNFVKNKGEKLPEFAHQLPFPIGGRYMGSPGGNLAQARKYEQSGVLDPVNNPKRYNFAADFMGHQDLPTVDEQMMALFDPKGKKAPEWYGVNEQTINDLAAQRGVSPVNFQEVAWAGGKGYQGKPMMQEINEMIHRTSRVTGQTPEEVIKGFVEGNKPMYGAGAAGLGASQLDTPEEKAAGGLTYLR